MQLSLLNNFSHPTKSTPGKSLLWNRGLLPSSVTSSPNMTSRDCCVLKKIKHQFKGNPPNNIDDILNDLKYQIDQITGFSSALTLHLPNSKFPMQSSAPGEQPIEPLWVLHQMTRFLARVLIGCFFNCFFDQSKERPFIHCNFSCILLLVCNFCLTIFLVHLFAQQSPVCLCFLSCLFGCIRTAKLSDSTSMQQTREKTRDKEENL